MALRAASLTLLALSTCASQAAEKPDLRAEVKQGALLRVVRTAEPELEGMGPLIIGSHLILVGEVVGQQARLSSDGTTVLTDYTFTVSEVVVDHGGRTAAGRRLVVTHPGGQLLVNGVAAHIESADFPPLSWLVPYVVFLREGPEGYRFWGGAQGVWELRDARVWSHLPDRFSLPVRKLYNRYKAESFFRWVRGTGGVRGQEAPLQRPGQAKAPPMPTGQDNSTLVDRAKRFGAVRHVIRPTHRNYHGLRERRTISNLVVRGRVVDQTTHLAGDGRTVWTDYTIEVLQTLKHSGTAPGPARNLTVRVEGGNLVVDGNAISVVNELFPPLPWVREHVFFLTRDGHDESLYRFLGGAQGVFRPDNGDRMRCHLPENAWEFLCRSRDGTDWEDLLKDLRREY